MSVNNIQPPDNGSHLNHFLLITTSKATRKNLVLSILSIKRFEPQILRGIYFKYKARPLKNVLAVKFYRSLKHLIWSAFFLANSDVS